MRAVRAVTDLPVGVGFGVQRPEQAAWVAGFADAVIVGSALARVVEERDGADAPARVAAFVGALGARCGRPRRGRAPAATVAWARTRRRVAWLQRPRGRAAAGT